MTPADPLFYLLGGTSLVGWNLFLQRKNRRLNVFGNPKSKRARKLGWPLIRLEEDDSYRRMFAGETPDVLIHCGGVCDVDMCEVDPAWARDINLTGLEKLLRQLPLQTKLIYVSSDHVFGGGADRPRTEDDSPTPISVYGKIRAEAEALVLSQRPESLVLRVGLPVGPSIDGKKGPLNWLASRTRSGRPTTIIEDEIRSIYWGTDLARRIFDLAVSNQSGARHIVGQTMASRAELAKFLNDRFSIGAKIDLKRRKDMSYPHLGSVPLATKYKDQFALPLRPVIV